LKRLFILLALLTLTTCATRIEPAVKVIHRPIGTTKIEYMDGTVKIGPNQYEPHPAPGFLVIRDSSGVVEGISFLLIAEWSWAPLRTQLQILTIADN